jgi:hypothetical protein
MELFSLIDWQNNVRVEDRSDSPGIYRSLSRIVGTPLVEYQIGVRPEISVKWRIRGELIQVGRSSIHLSYSQLDSLLAQGAGLVSIRAAVSVLRNSLGVEAWGVSWESDPRGNSLRLYAFKLHEHPLRKVWDVLLSTPGFDVSLPPEPLPLAGGDLSVAALTVRNGVCAGAKIYSRVPSPVRRMPPVQGCEAEQKWLSALVSKRKVDQRVTWIQWRCARCAPLSTVMYLELARPVTDPFALWELPADAFLKSCTETLESEGFVLRHLGISLPEGDGPVLTGYWSTLDPAAKL